MGLKAVLDQYVFLRQKYKGPFSIDYRERGSHARGVYPAQYTSRVGTVRMREEEKSDKNNSNRVVRNVKEGNVGTMREKVPNKA